MTPEEEVEQLSLVFVNLGSTPQQAKTMASQVVKRADQLAKTRGKGRVEALQYLMNLVVSGHSGVDPKVKGGKNIEKTNTKSRNLNDL